MKDIARELGVSVSTVSRALKDSPRISPTQRQRIKTYVEQRGVNVGEEAANILISHVEGRLPLNHVERRVVRTRLIIRGTTR